ncbi:MAG: hypothetical protein JW751_24225 [Polyangiaceae bacterium]|nr:hypothetical protein [Polyangiaceae bacterium]
MNSPPDVPNPWCRTLGIERPRLETVAHHREANTYARLIVALLERGEAMTLEEVAQRFALAGVSKASNALTALSRCRPARPPVYRDGDRYYLDPHDDDLDLWVFRLDLRPPKRTDPSMVAETLEASRLRRIKHGANLAKLRRALLISTGATSKLRARLEANVKSLHALYEYGRLHGAVRLRWGFLDEHLPAPWVSRDEPTLHDLKEAAFKASAPLDVVVGGAPGWADPWSRAQLAWVVKPPAGWRTALVDAAGFQIDEDEVQRARLAAPRASQHEPGQER